MTKWIALVLFAQATLAGAADDGEMIVTDIDRVAPAVSGGSAPAESAATVDYTPVEAEVTGEYAPAESSEEAAEYATGATAPSQYAATSGALLSGEEEGRTGQIDVEYFAVLYGPSIGKPNTYQPTVYGEKDFDHPVTLRNFVGVGYNINEEIAVTPTASWLWNPIGKTTFVLQDPYLRVSHNSVMSSEIFNWYSDARVHLPVTRLSQDEKLRMGLQSFNALVVDIPDTSVSVGAYASVRANFFGDNAYGNDLELYLAPNINYQYSDNASIILAYEMNAVHVLGTKAWSLQDSGTALQPGMAWLVTPKFMVNPFLNITTGGKVSLDSTSLGLNISLKMI